ncbi:hypothetical protein CEV31_0590 [Brucella thiophenivorans]|uniref:Uncharacterized protein n=1 Tax=Brucella thiophenivorans TaxID=571255 RepID=A0A256G4Z5_9HYPH|nr:hypothetical protein CEV31_0590 [Brucella thiophenivorans]
MRRQTSLSQACEKNSNLYLYTLIKHLILRADLMSADMI